MQAQARMHEHPHPDYYRILMKFSKVIFQTNLVLCVKKGEGRKKEQGLRRAPEKLLSHIKNFIFNLPCILQAK